MEMSINVFELLSSTTALSQHVIVLSSLPRNYLSLKLPSLKVLRVSHSFPTSSTVLTFHLPWYDLLTACNNYPMETQGERWCIAPTHSRPRHYTEVSGKRHAPAALYPGERIPCTQWTGAGWAPESVWTQRLEEKSFASAGDRTLLGRSSSP
jgi:hypothetical protein